MPWAAPKICHCGKVVPSGSTCSCRRKARAESNARYDKKRPNSTDRGYDREWEREAKAFLLRPGNDRCARCGKPAKVVMHIQSIKSRPDLRMVRSNWRPGCQSCNAIEAAAERRQFPR